MSVSDLDLALRAKDGDRVAFRRLLERHYDTLYRVAYRFFGNAAEAEDVAQEIAMTLADRIDSFRGESRLSTWLYRVAFNACRDHARRQRNVRDLQTNYMAFAEHRAADWADSDEKVRWLYRAVGKLEPALKETALLVLAEDMSHAEAGEVQGVAESTVSWRMHEVKKRLKNIARSGDE
jgi:RNA polymerase sigma-70 factor (ECF subfamily)